MKPEVVAVGEGFWVFICYFMVTTVALIMKSGDEGNTTFQWYDYAISKYKVI